MRYPSHPVAVQSSRHATGGVTARRACQRPRWCDYQQHGQQRTLSPMVPCCSRTPKAPHHRMAQVKDPPPTSRSLSAAKARARAYGEVMNGEQYTVPPHRG